MSPENLPLTNAFKLLERAYGTALHPQEKHAAAQQLGGFFALLNEWDLKNEQKELPDDAPQ